MDNPSHKAAHRNFYTTEEKNVLQSDTGFKVVVGESTVEKGLFFAYFHDAAYGSAYGPSIEAALETLLTQSATRLKVYRDHLMKELDKTNSMLTKLTYIPK